MRVNESTVGLGTDRRPALVFSASLIRYHVHSSAGVRILAGLPG